MKTTTTSPSIPKSMSMSSISASRPVIVIVSLLLSCCCQHQQQQVHSFIPKIQSRSIGVGITNIRSTSSTFTPSNSIISATRLHEQKEEHTNNNHHELRAKSLPSHSRPRPRVHHHNHSTPRNKSSSSRSMSISSNNNHIHSNTNTNTRSNRRRRNNTLRRIYLHRPVRIIEPSSSSSSYHDTTSTTSSGSSTSNNNEYEHRHAHVYKHHHQSSSQLKLSTGLSFDDGDQLLVSAQKPLGIILEEREDEMGCFVASLVPNGNAALAGVIQEGDLLVAVQNADVGRADFEEVMSRIANAPRVVNLRFWRKER